MTTRFPTGAVVSRALRRDVSIITQPLGKIGYHVSGKGTYQASIGVDVSDAEPTNVRAARELAHELREVYGWTVDHTDGSSLVYVTAVPSKADAANSLLDYATGH